MDHHARVMTWNIWWRFGPRWRERQPGILATIERFNPDVVALQEVWSDGETTQADQLVDQRMDHILFRPGHEDQRVNVETATVAGDAVHGVFPSDHRAVVC